MSSDSNNSASVDVVEVLLETNNVYEAWIDEWRFLRSAYGGTKDLVAFGALLKHERESAENYRRRVDEAYGFSYSSSIVELLNFYLFKEPIKRTLPDALSKDALWDMFTKDCDLFKTPFSQFVIEQSKNSSVEGHVGVLIDKPPVSAVNREEEVRNSIYPYVSFYRPQSILNWKWERDRYNKPILTMIKLAEPDGIIRIWTREKWEVWQLTEDIDFASPSFTRSDFKKLTKDSSLAATLISQGENELGEIPFVWLFNNVTGNVQVGKSDISDVSRIDASILRNLSQLEEVINYAAFPMLRKPKAERGEVQEDLVGVTAILEFDPEHPESKPDWLEAATGESVQAILSTIDKKISEIYRSSNVGGQAAMEISTAPKSGTALKAEFQLLNSKLTSKAKKIENLERQIIYYWMKWQNLDNKFGDVRIEYPTKFDVESLAEDLENILTSKSIVKSSPTFNKKLEKKTVRLLLPTESDVDLKEIDNEIDSYEPLVINYNPDQDKKNNIGGEE